TCRWSAGCWTGPTDGRMLTDVLLSTGQGRPYGGEAGNGGRRSSRVETGTRSFGRPRLLQMGRPPRQPSVGDGRDARLESSSFSYSLRSSVGSLGYRMSSHSGVAVSSLPSRTRA